MKEIELTQGKIAIVDDEDFHLVADYQWYACRNGRRWRAVAKGRQGKVWMHRVIMDAPANMQIDHIDHNGLNNRRYNLRFATNQQNNWNRKANANSSSRYKGVDWYKQFKKWRAQIWINGKNRHLGYSSNEEDAARIYNRAAKELFGDFAYLNEVVA